MTILHGFDWRRTGTLHADERAFRTLACGCVAADPRHRCFTARHLQQLRAEAEQAHGYGSPQWDAAHNAVIRHLNGEG